MARLFVAVWPPDDVLDQLAALERPPLAGVRWTAPSQWHATLRFLGEVERPGEAVDAFAEVRAARAPVVLGPATRRLGPAVWIVPLAGLDEVAAEVVRATATIGEPPDERPFLGHLTLARLKRPPVLPTPAAITASWDVTEVALVQSHLGAAGARYETIATVGLS